MKSVPITTELSALQENKLLKILGVGFGLAIVIGGMIGTGIFRTPGIIGANLGNAWLIVAVWIFGGVYALIGASGGFAPHHLNRCAASPCDGVFEF